MLKLGVHAVLSEILGLIKKADHVLILGHVNADGDVVGSTSAFYHRFINRVKSIQPIFFEPISERYSFLEFDPYVKIFAPDDEDQQKLISQADLLVVLDLATVDRIPGWEGILDSFEGKVICMDHHPLPKRPLGDITLIEPSACATGEILYELFQIDDQELTRQEALGLFTAVTTDTGWFRYTNTRPEVLALAADLLSHDIEPSQVYGKIYQVKDFSQVQLAGKLAEETRSALNDQVLWVLIKQDTLDRFGVEEMETEDLLDALRSVKNCRCVALFRESKDAVVRVNLRSKGNVDVNRIAQKFGGGGHRKAAGATMRDVTLDDAAEQVVGVIVETLSGEE